MWHTHYEVVIHSPPAVIWRILTDLDRYGDWNRYSPSAVGDLRIGGIVRITAHLGTRVQHVNNRVLELIPNQSLSWRSLNWYAFLVYGIRRRPLTPQPDGTTLFRQEETFQGLLAGIIRRMMVPHITAGLRLECESLKVEVERQALN